MAGFISAHGGYEDLLSFKKARAVYDGAVQFCQRFLDSRDRTVDQVVQAGHGRECVYAGRVVMGTPARRAVPNFFPHQRNYLLGVMSGTCAQKFAT